MQGDWLDDEALSAAVREWADTEEFDAYRVQLMLDQAAAGQVTPTGDDATLFALVELLKSQGRLISGEGKGERDPARIEQTHQAALAAFVQQQKETDGESQDAS